MESGCRRYEQTDEYVHLIAQDFGVSRSHFDRLVKKWGWKKRSDRPPLGLPPAQRILQEAAAATADNSVVGQGTSGDKDAKDMTPIEQGNVVERLQRAVEKELAAVELMRAKYGPLPQPSADAQRTASTLATLTDTLFKVQRLRATETLNATADDYDMPANIDEFRHALARRIENFVRSRANATVPAAGASAGATSSG
jgi:hypothetical protein